MRAKQTAEILTEFARWPSALDCAALSPGESSEAVLEALRAQRHKTVAIVGHQPSLGELVAACIPGHAQARSFELRKFGVVLLSFDGMPRAGQGTLRWLVAPKLLRALS